METIQGEFGLTLNPCQFSLIFRVCHHRIFNNFNTRKACNLSVQVKYVVKVLLLPRVLTVANLFQVRSGQADVIARGTREILGARLKITNSPKTDGAGVDTEYK